MSPHWKRSLIVFALAGLGVLLLCLRPALAPNSFEDNTRHGGRFALNPRGEMAEGEDINLNVTWDILGKDTILDNRGRVEETHSEPLSLLKKATITLSVKQDGDKLQLLVEESDWQAESALCQVKARFSAYYLGCRSTFNKEGEVIATHHLMRLYCNIGIIPPFLKEEITFRVLRDIRF